MEHGSVPTTRPRSRWRPSGASLHQWRGFVQSPAAPVGAARALIRGGASAVEGRGAQVRGVDWVTRSPSSRAPPFRHKGARIGPGATPGAGDGAAWNPETDKPIRAIALAPSANT